MTTTTAPPSVPPPSAPSAHDGLRGSASSDRRRQRIWRFLITIILIGAVAAGVVAIAKSRSGTPTAAAPAAAPVVGTLSVRNITNEGSFDGTIFHATAMPLQTFTAGHITALAPVGTVIDNGDEVYAIDDLPTVLMIGKIPIWRDLGPASTPGADIGQLQNSLKALGFDPEGQITANDTFDSATAAAVVHWQNHLGVSPTGNVVLGALIFEPSAITMGAQFVGVGSSVSRSTSVADAQLPGVAMQFTIPTDTTSLLAIGQSVDVTMPDRTTSKGIIRSIGASTDSSGVTTTVGRGDVTPPKNAAIVTDGAAVKVRTSQTVATGVLVAPAAAITTHVDGTFTINVIQTDGSIRTVAVEPGLSNNGSVQVTGENLIAGVKVQLPSTA